MATKKAPLEARLTIAQFKHLDGRLKELAWRHATGLVEARKPAETASVTAAKRVVAEHNKKVVAADKAARAASTKALVKVRETMHFGTAEAALAAVNKIEAEVNRA